MSTKFWLTLYGIWLIALIFLAIIAPNVVFGRGSLFIVLPLIAPAAVVVVGYSLITVAMWGIRAWQRLTSRL